MRDDHSIHKDLEQTTYLGFVKLERNKGKTKINS